MVAATCFEIGDQKQDNKEIKLIQVGDVRCNLAKFINWHRDCVQEKENLAETSYCPCEGSVAGTNHCSSMPWFIYLLLRGILISPWIMVGPSRRNCAWALWSCWGRSSAWFRAPPDRLELDTLGSWVESVNLKEGQAAGEWWLIKFLTWDDNDYPWRPKKGERFNSQIRFKRIKVWGVHDRNRYVYIYIHMHIT